MDTIKLFQDHFGIKGVGIKFYNDNDHVHDNHEHGHPHDRCGHTHAYHDHHRDESTGSLKDKKAGWGLVAILGLTPCIVLLPLTFV